jgi:hypothetical protein
VSRSPPESPPETGATAGQFRVLEELRGRGVLTDSEFGTAVSRLRATPKA